MLVLDTNVLLDYLTGVEAAGRFLERYDREEWAVPSIVLYEAMMGAVYGHLEASPETVHRGVGAAMEVLPANAATASAGVALQRELLERGTPVAQLDALIAASAREHGGTFATAEKVFWSEEVRSVLDIDPYDPS